MTIVAVILAFIVGVVVGALTTAFQFLVAIGKAAAKRDARKKTGGAS